MEDTITDVNRAFGGLNPGTYRLFMTQGEMDPSRSLGPSNDINPLSPVVVIPRKFFCNFLDLYYTYKKQENNSEGLQTILFDNLSILKLLPLD